MTCVELLRIIDNFCTWQSLQTQQQVSPSVIFLTAPCNKCYFSAERRFFKDSFEIVCLAVTAVAVVRFREVKLKFSQCCKYSSS